MTVATRPATAGDRDFIRSGWSASWRSSPYAGLLAMDTYASVMHREIDALLDRPTARALVAHEPGEFDDRGRPFLYGFVATLAAATPYVLYVYVKAPYRRGKAKHGLPKGIATMLFEAAGVDPTRPFAYACKTSYVSDLARKIPLAEWDPMPARYKETR